MMRRFVAVILLVYVSSMIGSCEGTDPPPYKLTVTIPFFYYDQLYSLKFFIGNLAPVYEEMSQCVQWQFVPCSSSKAVDDVKYCEHASSCPINVLHVCAAYQYDKDQYKLGRFFVCMMTYDATDKFEYGQKCAKVAGMDWNKLKSCEPSTQVADFCKRKFDGLAKYHLWFELSVIFNEKYDEKLEGEALIDLKKTICDRFQALNKFCGKCPGGHGQ